MRTKIFYISVFLIFVLLLSSCTGELLTDKELIVKVIEDFFSALSEQKWDLAKSYCVDGSLAYAAVDNVKKNLEDLSSQCFIATINTSADISKVDDIVGDKALAYGYLTIVTKCDGKEIPGGGSMEFKFGLQKISHNWKLIGWAPVY